MAEGGGGKRRWTVAAHARGSSS
eukprot:COSAG02_NODE_3425_length_6768_cov_9.839106_6_plen_22_part_01